MPAPHREYHPPPGMRAPLAALALVGLAVVAWYPALAGGFLSDDWPLIADNPYLRDPGAIPRFFSHGAWASSALELPGDRLYRPLFLLALYTLHAAFGADPVAYHAATLVLHASNTLLVLAVTRRLLPEAGLSGAVLAAAVFALHPAQGEVLGWIAAINEALLGAFVLSALLAWLRFRDSGAIRDAALALLALVLALGTKETALALVLAVLVLELRERRPAVGAPRRWPAYAAAAAVTAAYLAVRHAALSGGAPLALTADGVQRLAEYLVLAARYALAPLPLPLPFWFEHPAVGTPDGLDIAVGAAAIALAALLAWRVPGARFPLAWLALFALPPLAGAFADTGAFALRFLYLPLAGLGWALAALWAGHRATGRPAAFAGAVVVACAVTAAHAALPAYRDEVAFYRNVIRSDPAGDEGDTQAAVRAYRDAVARMPPGDARARVLESLALLLARQGRHEESLDAYRGLLALPEHAGAGHAGIANNLWALGRLREALDAYGRAIEAAPDHFEAHYNRAYLSERLQMPERAAEGYAAALALPAAARHPQAVAHARAFLARQGAGAR